MMTVRALPCGAAPMRFGGWGGGNRAFGAPVFGDWGFRVPVFGTRVFGVLVVLIPALLIPVFLMPSLLIPVFGVLACVVAGFRGLGPKVPGFKALGFKAQGFKAQGFKFRAFQAPVFLAPVFLASVFQASVFMAPGFMAPGFQDSARRVLAHMAPTRIAPSLIAPGFIVQRLAALILPARVFAVLALGLWVGGGAPAQGFDLRLPAESYGKVSFAARQSLGDAAHLVQDRRNVFEPMSSLREDDPLRRLTRAVGRLDLLIEEDGDRFTSSCTATLVNDGAAILTNHHCIPGSSGRVLKASLLLDYYEADSPTQRLAVATAPLVADRGLDFALVPVLDPVPAGIAPIPLRAAPIAPRERLIIVHHPQGQPKKMTQFGCTAAPSISQATFLRHRCDTLPGSSGAPILNLERQVVGLHHSGGLTSDDPKSFNLGTRLASVWAATNALEGALEGAQDGVQSGGQDVPSSGSPRADGSGAGALNAGSLGSGEDGGQGGAQDSAQNGPQNGAGAVNALIETQPRSQDQAPAETINQIIGGGQ